MQFVVAIHGGVGFDEVAGGGRDRRRHRVDRGARLKASHDDEIAEARIGERRRPAFVPQLERHRFEHAGWNPQLGRHQYDRSAEAFGCDANHRERPEVDLQFTSDDVCRTAESRP